MLKMSKNDVRRVFSPTGATQRLAPAVARFRRAERLTYGNLAGGAANFCSEVSGFFEPLACRLAALEVSR
jgi:hypothetical protein